MLVQTNVAERDWCWRTPGLSAPGGGTVYGTKCWIQYAAKREHGNVSYVGLVFVSLPDKVVLIINSSVGAVRVLGAAPYAKYAVDLLNCG